MDIKEYNTFYHVDISTQIDNKWRNDSVLAIVKDHNKYSLKIRGIDKEKIKKRFIINEKSRASKRHNRKIIVAIYSFLLYKSLCEFSEANPLLICRDVRPERLIMEFFTKIANFFNNKTILNRVIKFRKRIEFETKEKLPKSLAGKYVKKVYQQKLPASKILDHNEIEELVGVIEKLSKIK